MIYEHTIRHYTRSVLNPKHVRKFGPSHAPEEKRSAQLFEDRRFSIGEIWAQFEKKKRLYERLSDPTK
jgi:hypothetical protein